MTTAPAEPALLECARWLCRARGFPVFPVGLDKKPLVSWKGLQTRLTTDPELVAWFSNGKETTGIGIATGRTARIVVVDSDDESSERYAAANLPPTEMMCRTSRGIHRYYQHPGGETITNRTKIKIAKGIALDVRGDGGFVVAPQSLHASGVRYERLGLWPPVDQLPVFDRAWITPARAETTRPRPARSRPPAGGAARSGDAPALARAYLATVEAAIEGRGGDAATFRVACLLVNDFALDDATALDLIREWNESCLPRWSDADLRKKLTNARNYGRNVPGDKLTPRGTRRAVPNTYDGPTRPIEDDPKPISREPHKPFALTDSGNAEYFAAQYGNDFRYDHRRKRWFVWNGHRWQLDADGSVRRCAKAAMRRRAHDGLLLEDIDTRAKHTGWALKSESRAKLDAFLYLAQAEPPIADAGDDWDAQSMLLGVPNGVVDLRSGQLRPGRRDDRIRRNTAVPFAPAATCPRWEQFLCEIFQGDSLLVEFVQKVMGYSLTGDTSEQILVIAHGTGANGKGTLYNTFGAVLGDYACTMPFSTIELHQRSAIPNDVAALDGPRFASASETNDCTHLNESRIKALTGCDPMSARFLHGEFFTFRPQAKFWLAVNHKPVVRDDSHGFWRRIRLLPFTQTFPVTPGLDAALKAEALGILVWAVRGCLAWQRDGLTPPPAVLEATETYKDDSDVIGDFLSEATDNAVDGEIRAVDLYTHYKAWADRHGFSERERFSVTNFGRKMSERVRRVRTKAGAVYVGLSLRDPVTGSDQ